MGSLEALSPNFSRDRSGFLRILVLFAAGRKAQGSRSRRKLLGGFLDWPTDEQHAGVAACDASQAATGCPRVPNTFQEEEALRKSDQFGFSRPSEVTNELYTWQHPTSLIIDVPGIWKNHFSWCACFCLAISPHWDLRLLMKRSFHTKPFFTHLDAGDQIRAS